MTRSADPISSTDVALEAAGVCVFEWTGANETIRLWGRGSGDHRDLEGKWLLPDFLTMLDGLSATCLSDILRSGGPSKRLDVVLSLADGRKLHFLGSFLEEGQAHGLLLGRERQVGRMSDVPVEAVYQPIIRLKDGMIAGFEALARWRTENGELLPASALEGRDQKLMNEGLALAMLDQAGLAIADWTSRYPALDLFVQVNLSGADLYRRSVLEKVAQLAQSGNIPDGALRIELTEQMALRDFEAGVAAASALKAAGADLVLDDFGSGHSSLAWLASIPASGIKLDSQLTQLPVGPRTDAILRSVAGLAKTLGMSVTAEGIEDFARVEFLKEIGCDYVQGYAYAYPLEKKKADRFLDSQKGLFDLTSAPL